jgi:hypothetical protein
MKHCNREFENQVPRRPAAQPEADIGYPGAGMVELNNIRAAGAGEDDPRGVRVFWGVLGPATERDKFRLAAPPVRGEDLPHSAFTRRRYYRFSFDGDSGKTVYFCLRYENGKGGEKGEGPFGPVLSAVIP